jgi:hypothetical protein
VFSRLKSFVEESSDETTDTGIDRSIKGLLVIRSPGLLSIFQMQ